MDMRAYCMLVVLRCSSPSPSICNVYTYQCMFLDFSFKKRSANGQSEGTPPNPNLPILKPQSLKHHNPIFTWRSPGWL